MWMRAYFRSARATSKSVIIRAKDISFTEVYRHLPLSPHGEPRRNGGHDHVRTVGSRGFGVGGRLSFGGPVAPTVRFSRDRRHEGGQADPAQKPRQARPDQPGG